MIQEAVKKIGGIVAGRAASGLRAVEMAQSLRPDVILMDITRACKVRAVEIALGWLMIRLPETGSSLMVKSPRRFTGNSLPPENLPIIAHLLCSSSVISPEV
jgi:DNA-binding NarL/FixJ family response regulator